jgi:hypothetical protein
MNSKSTLQTLHQQQRPLARKPSSCNGGSRPDYLITSGGYWTGSPYTFLGASVPDDDGPAVPTTLMPTGHGIDANDMIRIDGFNAAAIDTRERMNTCVAPDFACGLYPVVPDLYKQNAACFSTDGPWTFIDFSSPGCNGRPFGFYAAVFIAGPPVSDLFGFFEAHPRDPNLSFQTFSRGVLARNGHRTFSISATNTYVMTSGATVLFTIPLPGTNKYSWPLIRTGNASLNQLGTDIGQWPLASGDVLQSDGHSGLVTFVNPSTGQKLILDYRDAGEPKRAELP